MRAILNPGSFTEIIFTLASIDERIVLTESQVSSEQELATRIISVLFFEISYCLLKLLIRLVPIKLSWVKMRSASKQRE